MGSQCNTPAALTQGKTRYRLHRRLGGSQSPSGRVRKIFPPPGFDPRTTQPVASEYDLCCLTIANLFLLFVCSVLRNTPLAYKRERRVCRKYRNAFSFASYVSVYFFISNFRRVLNAVFFLLGNSPAPEFHVPTFRNTYLLTYLLTYSMVQSPS